MFEKNRSVVTTIALSVSSMLILAGCAAGAPEASRIDENCTPAHSTLNTLTKGVLTVGVPDLPPLVFPDGSGGMDGIDAKIITGFAEAECLKIDAVTVSPAAAVASVEQGRVDTSLGGWYRSTARNKIVTMSGPMYLDAIIIASSKSYKTFDELKGLKVAITQGYVFQSDLEAIYGSKLSVYPEVSLMAEDLSSGRIDAAFDVASSTSMYKDWTVSSLDPDQRVPLSVQPTQTGLPFKKGDDSLVNAFNEYLTRLHAKGDIAGILKQWDINPQFADVGEPRFI
jgi:polar amino acid transport system substrate-binding protein